MVVNENNFTVSAGDPAFVVESEGVTLVAWGCVWVTSIGCTNAEFVPCSTERAFLTLWHNSSLRLLCRSISLTQDLHI